MTRIPFPNLSALYFLTMVLAGLWNAPPVVGAEPLAITCDVHAGPCAALTPAGTEVRFDISPKPVAVMRELSYLVTLRSRGKPLDAAAVELDLSMPGMKMGTNRPLLTRTDTGRFEGKGVIVRCMSGKKTWQAKITAKEGARREQVVFQFEVR